MKEKMEYLDYIKDIIDAMKKAEKFTDKIDFIEFEKDDKTNFAVIRALEIVGEATKKIPKFVKVKHPEIPWKEMTGMRDKMIHDYFGVDLSVVWDTVKVDIPKIKPLIKKIIKDLVNK